MSSGALRGLAPATQGQSDLTVGHCRAVLRGEQSSQAQVVWGYISGPFLEFARHSVCSVQDAPRLSSALIGSTWLVKWIYSVSWGFSFQYLFSACRCSSITNSSQLQFVFIHQLHRPSPSSLQWLCSADLLRHHNTDEIRPDLSSEEIKQHREEIDFFYFSHMCHLRWENRKNCPTKHEGTTCRTFNV